MRIGKNGAETGASHRGWEHRAELEAADDPRVQADSQSWCRYRAPTARVPLFRPRTRRWQFLHYDYLQGDADAACEIEQRLRAVLPKRKDCTPPLVTDAADICVYRRRLAGMGTSPIQVPTP